MRAIKLVRRGGPVSREHWSAIEQDFSRVFGRIFLLGEPYNGVLSRGHWVNMIFTRHVYSLKGEQHAAHTN